MKRKILGLFILLFTAEVFAQNSRGFELSMDSNYTPYTPTGKMPEIVVQEGNNGAITHLKYSNDNKYIMSATSNEARIFEVESGVLVKGFELGIFKDFSPNAKYIVSTSKKKENLGVFLTNIETREVIELGKRYDYRSVEMSFSSDGRYLAVPMIKWIDIYDLVSKKKMSILNDCGYYFADRIAWSEDNSLLSIITSLTEGYHGNSIVIYDINNAQIVNSFLVKGQQMIHYTSFSPDGDTIAWVQNDKVGFKQVNDTSVNYRHFPLDLKKGAVCGLSFSNNGRTLTAVQKETITICDMNTYEFQSFDIPQTYSFTVAKNSGEYAFGRFNRIEFLKSGKFIGNTKKGLETIYYDRQNENIIISDLKMNSLSFFDSTLQRKQITNQTPKNISCYAFFNGGFYWSENDKLM